MGPRRRRSLCRAVQEHLRLSQGGQLTRSSTARSGSCRYVYTRSTALDLGHVGVVELLAVASGSPNRTVPEMMLLHVYQGRQVVYWRKKGVVDNVKR